MHSEEDLLSIPRLDIDRFLNEDFFTLLGLSEVKEEEKANLLEKLGRVVLARAYAIAIELIPENQRESVADLPPDEMIPFFFEQGIDIPAIVGDESLRYRAEVAQYMLALNATRIPFSS